MLWRAEAQTLYSEYELSAITSARGDTERTRATEVDLDATAAQIIATVSDKRSVWTA
ncbi:hypothetical protein [Cryobacterium aureum]|uniref:hypothetical protein n=1 Tax=Cryobacterium aureum TaxID=995037 RepID=UPI00196A7DA2|nr:hypothetical protein [Cryobacterium aureum]